MEVYFVRTRHVYESYTDMVKLIQLSDFPLVYTDEVDISNPYVYILITMNGEWEPHIRNQMEAKKRRQAHLIQWNIERPAGSAGSVHYYAERQWQLMHDRFFDECWVSDSQLADETGLRFVVLGSDEGLGEPGEHKEYDFCHMSAIVPRRSGIYTRFPESRIGPNCWPPERDEVLKKSRFALNVHQDIYSYQEPLRFALFSAYGLPIVSESLVNSYPYSDEYMVTAAYPNLVGRMRQVLENDYSIYRDMGLRARDRMTKTFRFRDMILKAVSEFVERWR